MKELKRTWGCSALGRVCCWSYVAHCLFSTLVLAGLYEREVYCGAMADRDRYRGHGGVLRRGNDLC